MARVGVLHVSDEGRWVFTYDMDWTAFPLSLHLPIGETRQDLAHIRTVERFFDNQLPEGTLRQSLAKRERLNEKDVWGILTRFGQDMAGALTVLPELDLPSSEQQFLPLADTELAAMIAKAREGIPLMAQQNPPRMSLAGAQEKLALHIKEDGSFWMPVGSTPSTHILKPENANPNYPFCPANEWYCMSLAQRIGLPVPNVFLRDISGERVYIVERYDRKTQFSGQIQRLHQIDLCQARNVPPSKKYEDEAGLSAEDLFSVVRQCTIPAAAQRAAMNWIGFNYLIGNSDAHAKNIAFLMKSKKPEVAPFYDMLCVEAYHKNHHLSMSIGGQSQAGWVEGDHWDAFALMCGLPQRALRTALENLKQKITIHFREVLENDVLLTTEREWLNQHVLPVITQRLEFLSAALMTPINNKALHQADDPSPNPSN
jgi:serine/threonine-protein kinase HipA